MASAETLTVTRVPEAKFSRFGRNSPVKATRTDKRYNHVDAESLNSSCKSSIRLLKPEEYKLVRAHTFDVADIYNSTSPRLDLRPRQATFIRNRYKQNDSGINVRKGYGYTHADYIRSERNQTNQDADNENMSYGQIRFKKDVCDIPEDTEVIEDTDLLEQVLKELNAVTEEGDDNRRKEQVALHRKDILESDIEKESGKSIIDNTHDGLVRHQLANQGKDPCIAKLKLNKGEQKSNDWKKVKFNQPERYSLQADGNGFRGSEINNQKSNVRHKKLTDISPILSSGNPILKGNTKYDDKKGNRPKSKTQTAIKHEGSSKDESGVSNQGNNRRFAGDGKLLAYRPGTSLDSFRREYLDSIEENPVEEVNDHIKEGHEIWQDIGDIVGGTDSRNGNRKSWKSRDKDTRVERGSDQLEKMGNSIEQLPRFQKHLESSYWSQQDYLNSVDSPRPQTGCKKSILKNSELGKAGIEDGEVPISPRKSLTWKSDSDNQSKKGSKGPTRLQSPPPLIFPGQVVSVHLVRHKHCRKHSML